VSDSDELRRRFERALAEDRTSELRELVQRVAFEAEDARWAEVACARLARHRNALLRGDALAAFGHLARRFGQLDRRRVQRLVEIGLHAHHEYVRERAASAADDLETYLAWRLDRPAS
jgi:hypothetical protein